MRLRIESALATSWNESLVPGEMPRCDMWEGVVPDMTLEEIFRYFNRVEAGDEERLMAVDYTLPSLSMGDTVTFLDTGIAWLCGATGWERV